MKKALQMLPILALAGMLAACSGGPEIDGSSPRAFKASVTRISQSLPAVKRAKFKRALGIVIMRDVKLVGMQKVFSPECLAGSDSSNPSFSCDAGKIMKSTLRSVMQSLDGKTAEEIIAMAKRQSRAGLDYQGF